MSPATDDAADPAMDHQMDVARVLTLNFWGEQDPIDARLRLVVAGCRALAPDVIALQEVLHLDGAATDQADDIAAGLGYHVAYGAAWEIGGGLHFGNAVLSRFPIAEHRTFLLPSGGDEQRALLYALVEMAGVRVPLFVTHLNWKFHQGAIRQRQVSFIADRIAEICPVIEKASEERGDRFPPILAGDFNAEPLADEIRFFAGWCALDGKSAYFADAFRLVGAGAGATFCRRNPFAAIAREPDRRIDYIFVRGPDRRGRGEPLACRVVLDQPEEGVFPSDHFGVYAELSTK